jgi:chromosomal replication initiation ATPase DnaA
LNQRPLLVFPELRKINFEVQINSPQWTDLNPFLRSGFGSYDRTFEPDHFQLFPHEEKSIEMLFIQPNYSIKVFSDLVEGPGKKTDFIQDCLSILSKQRILFLLGPYGSGKTFLTKILQKHLLQEGEDVVFIECASVAQVTKWHDFKELAGERKPARRDIYFVFDGYDDANFLRQECDFSS